MPFISGSGKGIIFCEFIVAVLSVILGINITSSRKNGSYRMYRYVRCCLRV